MAQDYEKVTADRWAYEPQTRIAWTLAVRWISQHWPMTAHPVRILDVGAHDGMFFRQLDNDCEKMAIEPSVHGREMLERHGIPVIDEFLREPSREHFGTFDFVTMFDVFEHLDTPGCSLSNALRYLKPGGSLILSTGNSQHWTWRWLQGQHWYCHTQQHLVFGNRDYFRSWASRHDSECATLRSHPHCVGAMRLKFRRMLETVIWGGLKIPWLRPVAGMTLRIPGLGYIRHRVSGPYAPELADHLFVVLRKPDAAPSVGGSGTMRGSMHCRSDDRRCGDPTQH